MFLVYFAISYVKYTSGYILMVGASNYYFSRKRGQLIPLEEGFKYFWKQQGSIALGAIFLPPINIIRAFLS